MAMVALGWFEVLLLMGMSSAGQPTDLVSFLTAPDYFQAHAVEMSIDKMVELASKDPSDPPSQIAQLLALRVLGTDGTFKKGPNYAAQRKILEEIAAGRKAQDKLGFAREYAQQALARLEGVKPPAAATLPARSEGLAWFPAAVTIAAGLESRPSSSAPRVDHGISDLLKKMPPEAKKQFYKAIDTLGNVQIQRVTMAYVDEGNGQGRNFVRLTGRFNQAWLRETLKGLGVEAKVRQDPLGTTLAVFVPDSNAPAIALIGDQDVLMAGFGRGGKNEELLAQTLALREKKQANAAGGQLKEALEKLPAKAVGFVIGAVPDEVGRGLGMLLGAFPKKVFVSLEQAPSDHGPARLDLIFRGEMEDQEQAKTLVRTAGKLRMDALDGLKKAQGAPPPGLNIDSLKAVLDSLRIEANGTNVSARLLLTEEAMSTLPYFLLGR